MTVSKASQILEDSLNNFIKKNYQAKSNLIEPADVSAEVIANGALAIIQERSRQFEANTDAESDDIDGHRRAMMNNLTVWLRTKDSIREIPEYKNIAACFKMGALRLVKGLSIEDAEYIEEEIFKLASDGNVEEVLKNWFVQKHGFDPLPEYAEDEENSFDDDDSNW